jgi:prepilin-type N-terminal cleavage/methylation domain-containing protein
MRRGFTLVEVLVVIGIIALLAAILFPVFARAKNAAKSSACLSNLHQIGQAMLLYMGDNDDFFPQAVDASDKVHPEQWAAFPEFQAQIPNMPMMQDALQPYCKSKEIFHCPLDNGSQVLDDHFPLLFQALESQYKTFGSSYLYRTEITFKKSSQTSLTSPADLNVLFDGAGHWHGSSSAVEQNDDFGSFARKAQGYRYNTLFGDMHGKSLQYGQLRNAWSTSL